MSTLREGNGIGISIRNSWLPTAWKKALTYVDTGRVPLVMYTLPLCFFSLLSGSAWGLLTITEDTTLTENYSGEGIVVEHVDGITLDCNHFTISGSGSGNGITLRRTTQVTVKNCQVTNFANGIVLVEAHRNHLTGNRAHHNAADGIELTDSDGNILTQNTANDNDDGIELKRSDGNVLTQNRADQNASSGFELKDSHGNVLTGNVAHTSTFGIELEHANRNILIRNTTNDNGLTGTFIQSSRDNTLVHNEADDNGEVGIGLFDDADQNRLIQNQAVGNGDSDFFNQGSDNTCIENHFEALSGPANCTPQFL